MVITQNHKLSIILTLKKLVGQTACATFYTQINSKTCLSTNANN
jgi:hypothetical protein